MSGLSHTPTEVNHHDFQFSADLSGVRQQDPALARLGSADKGLHAVQIPGRRKGLFRAAAPGFWCHIPCQILREMSYIIGILHLESGQQIYRKLAAM